MQPGTCQSLLVHTDVSGFTKFMKLHTITHAKQIIVKLLESILSEGFLLKKKLWITFLFDCEFDVDLLNLVNLFFNLGLRNQLYDVITGRCRNSRQLFLPAGAAAGGFCGVQARRGVAAQTRAGGLSHQTQSLSSRLAA
jgi:hypothetical protein